MTTPTPEEQRALFDRAIQLLRDSDRDVAELTEEQFGDVLPLLDRLNSGDGTVEDALEAFGRSLKGSVDLFKGMVLVINALTALRQHEVGPAKAETLELIQNVAEYRPDWN